jgi:Uncharacterised nucleotidyltransferase
MGEPNTEASQHAEASQHVFPCGQMQLPPLNAVAAALRMATEILATEVAVPSKQPPLWTDFEWRIARAVAAMQGVSTLLCRRLRWQGPPGWRLFLEEQRRQSLARHRHIAGLLETIDAEARRQGVALVALKGAALHAANIYAAGERPMGDIDLLARGDDVPAVARVLDACGYQPAFVIQRHQVFQPRAAKPSSGKWLGEHEDNPIKIEVHSQIAERLPVTMTDITQLLFPREMSAGLNAYPSNASLMLHLLLHAAGNMRARAVRLIQLHDIALLASSLGATDWEELLAANPDGQPIWWALAPLTLTASYYPAAIPAAVLSRARMGCPWLLAAVGRRQRLADVSWSNIRIAAFPGVEWSRTLGEALTFMRSRIWPSREARLELQEGAAQIPNSATVPWYGISHPARILRWVFTRPPRVQTLLSVKIALAQDS